MSHTPTPFEAKELHNNYDGFVLLYKTPGGKRRVDNKQGVFTKEDAYFIVRACNSYEAMKEACQTALDNLKPKYSSDHIVIRQLTNALTLAEGKE